MSQFLLYYKLGLRYILDIYSVEYILFLISLLVVFSIKDWKRVIILLVFFILGYTLTISLASFGVMKYNVDLIEFLLPLTIFFTSFTNVFKKKDNFRYQGNMNKNYVLAVLFGAIHGFSYSTYFVGIAKGSFRFWDQFLAFNLGVGSAQVAVSLVFLIIAFLFLSIIGINRRDWLMVISSGIAGVAITLMFDSKFW
ncbi:MAG: HupE/UreJ family protein [Cyclobacteriaceae bacterium]|nr:HupE/UreJ family protein [Cyclobacteriaceae bacterium]